MLRGGIALRRSSTFYTLRSLQYVVARSVGLYLKALRTTFLVLDRGVGFNFLRKDVITWRWEHQEMENVELPATCDGNGRPLHLQGAVECFDRLANIHSYVQL